MSILILDSIFTVQFGLPYTVQFPQCNHLLVLTCRLQGVLLQTLQHYR